MIAQQTPRGEDIVQLPLFRKYIARKEAYSWVFTDENLEDDPDYRASLQHSDAQKEIIEEASKSL